MSAEPSEAEIVWIFTEHPDTTFITISRARAAWVNSVALGAFFPDQEPLVVHPGDPESNPDNFVGTQQVGNEPMPLPIFAGLRVTFTRNINKDMDYVNGMGATVLDVHTAGVRAGTDTGKVAVVYPWTSEERVTFYPIKSATPRLC